MCRAGFSSAGRWHVSQAVQQMVAVMASHAAVVGVASDTAIAAVEAAFGNRSVDATFMTACAKARASEACYEVTRIAHQLHGAIGYTREHDLHRFTRRLWTWRDADGDEGYWQERVGAAAIRGERGRPVAASGGRAECEAGARGLCQSTTDTGPGALHAATRRRIHRCPADRVAPVWPHAGEEAQVAGRGAVRSPTTSVPLARQSRGSACPDSRPGPGTAQGDSRGGPTDPPSRHSLASARASMPGTGKARRRFTRRPKQASMWRSFGCCLTPVPRSMRFRRPTAMRGHHCAWRRGISGTPRSWRR